MRYGLGLRRVGEGDFSYEKEDILLLLYSIG